jgi:dUTP pyrophosphatase
MSAKFEIVSKYADRGINLPCRKTKLSAGYDFEVAEDITIPSFAKNFVYNGPTESITLCSPADYSTVCNFTKCTGRPMTLVPTGIKCKLDPGTYLELSVRSSTPLKSGLMLANGVGIIDADYYNNPDNEGHIFFQIVNLTPFDIKIPKGTAIGQGIIKSYLTTEDDNAESERTGGFGSTDG